MVEWLLEKGANVNCRTLSNFNTPMLAAARYCQHNIMLLLLKNGGSVHDTDCNGNSSAMVSLLYSEFVENYKEKIESNIDELGRKFIKNTLQKSIIAWCIHNGVSPTAKNNDGDSLILIASQNRDYAFVKLLVSLGCPIRDKTSNNDTCLLLAASQGNLELFKWFETLGLSITDRNNFGENTILVASRKGHLKLIQYLVNERNCSLQDVSIYGTCIMNAAKNNHQECIKWMLQHGSSIHENATLDKNEKVIADKSCKVILKENNILSSFKKSNTTTNHAVLPKNSILDKNDYLRLIISKKKKKRKRKAYQDLKLLHRLKILHILLVVWINILILIILIEMI